MRRNKYAIHDQLKSFSKFSLPMSTMTTLGSSINNLFSDISCVFVKVSKDLIKYKHIISGYQAGKIKLVTYEPVNQSNMPCLIYFHGGGFALKASASSHRMAMYYAKEVKCKVIFVNYRTSSHHKFPTSVEDCYESSKWVYEHAQELGINPEKIALGGDSAGGGLAASVTQMLRNRDRMKPTYQLLIYPVTDSRLITESMKQFIDTPIWHSKLSRKMWQFYLRETSSQDQTYASPLATDDFERLPDAYIEVAEFDCLRDEGILYADKLKEAGVDVTLKVIKGAFHGYDMMGKKSMVKEALAVRLEALKKGLN